MKMDLVSSNYYCIDLEQSIR